MCGATAHVRFTPNSDRESGHWENGMSALPAKADICDAQAQVRFGPEADICTAPADVRFTPKSDIASAQMTAELAL